MTAAVLVRKVSRDTPTLLLDESDAAFRGEKEYAETLRSILNSGYRRGGVASLCVKAGGDFELRDFPVFCPKALAGIGKLPDTVADRSISLKLKRKAKGEPVARFRLRDSRAQATPLQERLGTWASLAVPSLENARPEIPDSLDDRAADIWEPLLAIADLAGGEWPERARKAAITLSGNGAAEDESAGVRLLADLQELFAAEPLGTNTLLGQLNTREESVWGTWNVGKGMRSQDLARLLKPFGIRPRTVRVTTGTLKGYHPDDFDDAFTRYLPSDGEKRVTPSHVSENGYCPPIVEQNVTPAAQIGASYKCYGVTDKLGGHGTEDVLEVE